VPKQNTEKGEFISNCRWYGLQTPGWKYKINYDSIRPKSAAAKYYKPIKEGGADGKPRAHEVISIKTKKTKDPAPGSYEVEDVYRKVFWPKNMFLFSKKKHGNYVDEVVKAKSYIPGIGKYKDIDKGMNILSKPPTSLRRVR
jgi:hypothetical protein